VGYGEAVPTLRLLSVEGAIKQVAKAYVGKNAEDLESNHLDWYKQDFYLPVSFESASALSAVDMACWDLVGRELGIPLYQMLGGKLRDQVPVYANGWYGKCKTPDEFYSSARRALLSYKALKFDPFGNHFDGIDEEGLREAEERVKAVVEAGALPLIEHHGRFNSASALAIAERLQKYGPAFMEEPVHPDDLEGLRAYRRSARVKIALGERIIGLKQALYYLREGLVDVLQPDVTNIGGVTAMKKVMALSEAFGVELAFHNAFGPVQHAFSLQLAAAAPNLFMLESFYDWFPSWKRSIVRGIPETREGLAPVPKGPGSGIQVDESAVERLRVEAPALPVSEEPVWVVGGTWGRAR